ncbi:MAG: acyl--CoA ligase, partial [Bacilli bacterium]|nr:acyl--CoA ligase [Bacilli bacterium]
MQKDILEQIKQLAKENSVKPINDEEIEQLVLETEENLGRELTGYGKLDKPHQQFYYDEAINREYICNERIGSRVIKECQKRRTKIAYVLGERKITYGELEENIISVAYKLKELGIKKGDFITMAALSTPEAIYVFFATSLIGAITRPIDPISSPNSIKANILTTNSKILITNDINFLKLKDITKGTNLESIIALPIEDAFSSKLSPEGVIFKTISKLSKKAISSQKNKWIKWADFLSNIPKDKLNLESIEEPYEEESIVSVLSTSGSTGEPRGVCLTDGNFILSVEKQMNSGFDVSHDENMYNPMPTCSSYFWQDILLAIMYGVPTTLEPLFNAKKSAKAIMNADCSIVLAGPIIIEQLTEYINKTKTTEIISKKIKHVVSGGDLLSLITETKGNQALSKIKPTLKVENALGTSETTGPAFNPNGIIADSRAYSIGSVGLILPGDEYSIFAYDSEDDTRNIYEPGYDIGLKYYEVGEICFSAQNKNVFKEYFKNQSATAATLVRHNDGTIWYHTGDLGYMDPAGFQYCSGRKSGLIVRDGHKIWSSKIERIVCLFEEVEDCAIIGVEDLREKEVPVLFIQYKENISE